MKRINTFLEESVNFIENSEVCHGVNCDVYGFIGNNSKDLGIITIQPNCATPKQLVVKGERTIEGFVNGSGKLRVIRDELTTEYKVIEGDEFQMDIEVGDIVQWFADKDSELVAYEVCFPPYEDGRFKNL